jgi:hypothetical protein
MYVLLNYVEMGIKCQCCRSENFFFYSDSDSDPHKFFRIGIQIWIRIPIWVRIRIRIQILQTYILGQTIPKFSFNGLRTFSEYNTMKKNFVTVKICASFHLTLVLVFVMLYY